MSSKRIFVNALTFARLPLIFAWMVLAIIAELKGSWQLAVLGGLFMGMSGITDLFDGYLARKWEVVSEMGKMADPLMDKVFYIVAFPAIAWQVMHQGESAAHGMVMMSFTILYMLRDTWVTFMRMVGSLYGADVAAAWLGKVRTALSFPGAGWIYLHCAFHRLAPESWQTPWLWSCYAVEGLLIALTLWSMYTYTVSYIPYLRRAMSR